MEGAEIAQAIGELETRVERLRALYDQYFMGIERIEPLTLRKDLDRRLWALRREQIRNTALRFKLETTIQRYNTYQQYWQRIVREIENGTYQRDLGRALHRFGEAATAFGRRRQKMVEKGLAKRAERDASRRAADSVAPLFDSQAPGAGDAPRPSEGPGASDDTAVTEPRIRAAAAAQAPDREEEGWDVDLDLELESPKPAEVVPQPIVPQARAAPAILSSRPPARVKPTVPPRPLARATPSPPRPAPLHVDSPAAPLGARRQGLPGAPSPVSLAQPQQAQPRASSPTASASAVRTDPEARKTAPEPSPPKIDMAGAHGGRGRSRPPPPAPTNSLPPQAVGKPDQELSAARLRQIYGEYVEAKRRANESTAALTFDKVAASLRQSASALRAKHGSSSVDFEVVLKNGKPAIKPVLKG